MKNQLTKQGLSDISVLMVRDKDNCPVLSTFDFEGWRTTFPFFKDYKLNLERLDNWCSPKIICKERDVFAQDIAQYFFPESIAPDNNVYFYFKEGDFGDEDFEEMFG
jgi:hypothetical protein